jgi:LuxR family transcriptional regulator
MILDYVEQLSRATAMDDVWGMHCAAMAQFGFDRLIYGYTRFVTDGSISNLDDAIFLTNHDPAYFERFVGERMFLDGPVVRWARDNAGPCSWGALWSNTELLSEEERNIIDFNRTMNVTAGYSISFSDPNPRSFGLIALAARVGLSQDDADSIWRRHGRQIEAMNQMLHLKVIALPQNNGHTNLTSRQREVLQRVGEGKSHQDIATILGVAVPTVEKHLRLARENLGVETTAQAILKAAFQNQIYHK